MQDRGTCLNKFIAFNKRVNKYNSINNQVIYLESTTMKSVNNYFWTQRIIFYLNLEGNARTANQPRYKLTWKFNI